MSSMTPFEITVQQEVIRQLEPINDTIEKYKKIIDNYQEIDDSRKRLLNKHKKLHTTNEKVIELLATSNNNLQDNSENYKELSEKYQKLFFQYKKIAEKLMEDNKYLESRLKVDNLIENLQLGSFEKEMVLNDTFLPIIVFMKRICPHGWNIVEGNLIPVGMDLAGVTEFKPKVEFTQPIISEIILLVEEPPIKVNRNILSDDEQWIKDNDEALSICPEEVITTFEKGVIIEEIHFTKDRRDEYKQWIKDNVKGNTRGKCAKYCELMKDVFPELIIMNGFYICPNEREPMPHHWCTVKGTLYLVDPTKDQFKSNGEGKYVW